jgi:major vault protein
LELKKSKALSEIETNKFKMLVSAIGPSTIQAIAKAGPEMQAKLLGGLGLKGYLMTDGNSPINLFNAAKGMVGQE